MIMTTMTTRMATTLRRGWRRHFVSEHTTSSICYPVLRICSFSSGDASTSETSKEATASISASAPTAPSHQRVWKSSRGHTKSTNARHFWLHNESDWSFGRSLSDPALQDMVQRVNVQEQVSARMQQRQLGVMREDPVEDMRLLVENYTVPALASALRDREDALQHCAELLKKKDYAELQKLLQPHEHTYILQRRQGKKLKLSKPLSQHSLEILRKRLTRMPRVVTQAHEKRAGVVVALCNVNGIPSLLLEKRAPHLRAHPDEVCLPGGMLCENEDSSIVDTSLREMREEISGLPSHAQVLGVLRCNWGEVHHLVGIAVTPIVVFVGEIGSLDLKPNPDEVAECFVVPLSSFMDRDKWVHREGFAPIFVGGPHIIWGLTGYICERFAKDILALIFASEKHPN